LPFIDNCEDDELSFLSDYLSQIHGHFFDLYDRIAP
jgi:hypothetical protein